MYQIGQIDKIYSSSLSQVVVAAQDTALNNGGKPMLKLHQRPTR
ncbi:hypothetical protein [Xylella taiwanensis]|nr:hypothetical protein [Xylella taiwanensis]